MTDDADTVGTWCDGAPGLFVVDHVFDQFLQPVHGRVEVETGVELPLQAEAEDGAVDHGRDVIRRFVALVGARRGEDVRRRFPAVGEELYVVLVDRAVLRHRLAQQRVKHGGGGGVQPLLDAIEELPHAFRSWIGDRSGVDELVDRALDDGDEQAFLVVEVPRDGTPADAGQLRDVDERGAREPLLGEQGFGSVQDAAAALLADLVHPALAPAHLTILPTGLDILYAWWHRLCRPARFPVSFAD